MTTRAMSKSLRSLSPVICFLLYLSVDNISLYSAPPLPSISNYNKDSYGFSDLGEFGAQVWIITVSGWMDVGGEVDRVDMLPNSGVNISGELTVGGGGIYLPSVGYELITGGALTSSVGMISIDTSGDWLEGALTIESTITNNGGQRVGLHIRSATSRGLAVVYLEGQGSNTFTGDVVIEGNNELSLKRTNGTGVQGDVYAVDGGVIFSHRTGNIARNTTVYLKGKGSAFGFHGNADEVITESFHRLEVEGSGRLTFWSCPANHYRTIYLDDLMVNEGSWLTIYDWRDGFSKLLVRKDSAHLQDALGRMEFEGYDRNAIHLEDFNTEYWQISGAPEPSTYGAVFSVGMLGIVAGLERRRKKQTRVALRECLLVTGAGRGR